MNCCTHLDEILHEHVPRQPLEAVEYQDHRSKVKVTWFVSVWVTRQAMRSRATNAFARWR